jgi:fructose-bisphosphate aldolase, class I
MADNKVLYDIAAQLLEKGKGLLAADESERTMKERLKSIDVPESYEAQRAYREILFTTPGLEEYISGVILYDSSMRDTTKDGIPFPDVLASRGIIPGIKVDLGTIPFTNFPGETLSAGLDDLPKRLAEYYAQGARFTKWRAAFAIDDRIPTDACITANAFLLARYAALVQEAKMVPIIEPEVLMHGTHTLERSQEVTMRVLQLTFAAMREFRVDLRGLILKSSMVIASDGAKDQTSPAVVASETLRTFHLSVPHEVPGIVFLSGGQAVKRSTENLQAITALGPQPWTITYSYSRALEEPVLAAWKGDAANAERAQKVLLERARQNSLAALGTYDASKDTL